MCNINYAKFLCRICVKNVYDKDKAAQCDHCELWVHMKCNNRNQLDYRYLQTVMNPGIAYKPSSNLELLVNQFNNATPENSNDTDKICSSKYYDIEEMCNIEIPYKNKSLFLSHLNTCSLNKNFDDFQHFSVALKNFLT